MKRWAFHIFAALSLLLCLATLVLWVRSRTTTDQASWTYDRYLPDKSAATTQVDLTSNKRIWLNINWGRVGPFNGQLVWGYYARADQSGGHPRFTFSHDPNPPAEGWFTYDADSGTTGWGPLRWHFYQRSTPTAAERFHSIRLGVSHWMLALLSLVLPMLWLHGYRKARSIHKLGLCKTCGYDLRATPDQCPECGTIFESPKTS